MESELGFMAAVSNSPLCVCDFPYKVSGIAKEQSFMTLNAVNYFLQTPDKHVIRIN